MSAPVAAAHNREVALRIPTHHRTATEEIRT